MRMLKKLLLAGAFIGVLGSFGFAQEAKADVYITPSGTNNDTLTISSNNVSANSAKITKIGDTATSINLGTDGALSKNGITMSIKDKVNSTDAAAVTASTVTSLTIEVEDKGGAKESKVYDFTANKLYKVSAKADAHGSVLVGTRTHKPGSTLNTEAWAYGYTGEVISISATADSGYKFDTWSPAPSFGAIVASGGITIGSAAEGPYTAYFVSKPVYDPPVLKATIAGTTYSSTSLPELYMAVGESVKFSATKPSGATKVSLMLDSDWSTYFRSDGSNTYTAKTDSGDWSLDAYARAYFGSELEYEDSDPITFYVSGTSKGGRINFSDFKNYITEGYTLEFTVKTNDQGAISSMAWDASTGGDYVDSYTVENTSNAYEKKVKIKFKGEKLDKGTNSATVKIRCKINGASGYSTIDNDTDTEKEITVYSNPTNSYNNSDRTMSYKVPAKVNTGTESGKDSNLSYTQDTVSEVKGIRINVLLNDNILGTTTTAASKGTGATVEASTMESIITNLGNSGKFTGDCTVVFRAYPSDSSGNCNKKVYHDTYAKVYKVVLRPGQSATAGSKTANAYALPIAMIAQRNTGATTTTATTTTAAGKEYVLYGLEGQTLTAPAGVTDLVDSNGNAVTKIVVSADANKNVYTYASTASASSREGLDKVPKTGQSNVFVYVMAVVICGAVGYGLYVYNKKSKKSI